MVDILVTIGLVLNRCSEVRRLSDGEGTHECVLVLHTNRSCVREKEGHDVTCRGNDACELTSTLVKMGPLLSVVRTFALQSRD